MITPMQMYWLLKLDDIRAACCFFIAFMIFVIIASSIGYRDNEEEGVKKRATARWISPTSC